MTSTVLFLSIASFAAGFIDSIAGGGGTILLPSLLLAGIPAPMALGTNKLIASTGTGIALINFIRAKKVIWKIVGAGIFFTFIGAYIGVRSVLLIDPEMTGKIIVMLLPVAIVATLVPKNSIEKAENTLSRRDLFLKVPLVCLAIGFYDGFFGPGTGSLLILGFHWFIGLSLLHSSATAKVFNFASNIGALIIFILNKKILFLFALPLIAANMAGGYLGSHVAIKKGSKAVQLFLIITLGILMVSMVIKYFW